MHPLTMLGLGVMMCVCTTMGEEGTDYFNVVIMMAPAFTYKQNCEKTLGTVADFLKLLKALEENKEKTIALKLVAVGHSAHSAFHYQFPGNIFDFVQDSANPMCHNRQDNSEYPAALQSAEAYKNSFNARYKVEQSYAFMFGKTRTLIALLIENSNAYELIMKEVIGPNSNHAGATQWKIGILCSASGGDTGKIDVNRFGVKLDGTPMHVMIYGNNYVGCGKDMSLDENEIRNWLKELPQSSHDPYAQYQVGHLAPLAAKFEEKVAETVTQPPIPYMEFIDDYKKHVKGLNKTAYMVLVILFVFQLLVFIGLMVFGLPAYQRLLNRGDPPLRGGKHHKKR